MIKKGWIEAHKVEGIDAGGWQKEKLDSNRALFSAITAPHRFGRIGHPLNPVIRLGVRI